MTIGPDDIKCFTAQVDKVVELVRRFVTPVDDVGHVIGEHERRTVALDVPELLSISEELAEINVEQVTCDLQHDVVVVSEM